MQLTTLYRGVVERPADEVRNLLAEAGVVAMTVTVAPGADVVDAATGRHLKGYSELRPRAEVTREEMLQLAVLVSASRRRERLRGEPRS